MVYNTAGDTGEGFGLFGWPFDDATIYLIKTDAAGVIYGGFSYLEKFIYYRVLCKCYVFKFG